MSTLTSASLLGNKVSSYENQVAKSTGKGGAEMGKQDFLTLFTAQLKNQNPLDPVKNEAFVAQLAQFSQLEATTNMQASLEKFVASMSSQQMFSATGLIGRRVAVTDSPLNFNPGDTPEAALNLADGASGVVVRILDAKGSVVREMTTGARNPGPLSFVWDGNDDQGNPAPKGTYSIKASAVVNGQSTNIPVETLATVQSVASNTLDGSLNLSLSGGTTLPLSQVKRIAY